MILRAARVVAATVLLAVALAACTGAGAPAPTEHPLPTGTFSGPPPHS